MCVISHRLLLPSSTVYIYSPFGAFLALLYGLTAAPASQPINALISQAVAIMISLIISNISFFPDWFKQSLSTSLTIGFMVKYGITHPPAGASAMIFSTSAVNNNSSKLNWTNGLTMVIVTFVIICISTVVNNFNTKRQYPTNWGLKSSLDFVKFVIRQCLPFDILQEDDDSDKNQSMSQK